MKLAFSTNAFTKYSVEEAVSLIGKTGYPGVEILADRPHLYPPEMTGETVGKLRILLKRHNLEVSNINANTASGYFNRKLMEPIFEPSLSNRDDDLRRWRIDYTKKCIDLAQELGSKCVSVTSGRPIPGCLPHIGIENFKKSLEEILIYGEKKEVSIGIEYEPGLLIENTVETLELLKTLNSEYLGVNLDIGHVVVAGEDPVDTIQSLSHHILNIHLEDIKGRKHYHLVPGQGNINIEAVVSTLKDNGYDRFVTVELYTYCDEPEEAAQEALRYLQNLDSITKGG